MTEWKKVALIALAGFVLTNCTPKKEEQVPQKEQTVQPKEKGLIPLQKPHEEKLLTPEQKEELKIEEDNVMNPFPG